MLALQEIYLAVRKRFDDADSGVQFAFGWRAVNEHTAGVEPRIVMVPGDESGNAGVTQEPETVSARDPQGRRILGRQQMLCRFYVTAPSDLNDTENELTQWANTALLRHALWRALKHTCGTQFVITAEKWDEQDTRLSDATLIMTVGIWDQILDDADRFTRKRVDGRVAQSLGDTTETYDVP